MAYEWRLYVLLERPCEAVAIPRQQQDFPVSDALPESVLADLVAISLVDYFMIRSCTFQLFSLFCQRRALVVLCSGVGLIVDLERT